MSYENSNLRQNNEIWRYAANIYYAWPSNLCREGASAGGPPEAQAPQPKAAALVFSMYSLEDKWFENMCELLNNAPDQGPAATGVTKNLYIIVMFHTFWIGMDPKHTYYYKFLNILKLDRYKTNILLEFC